MKPPQSFTPAWPRPHRLLTGLADFRLARTSLAFTGDATLKLNQTSTPSCRVRR